MATYSYNTRHLPTNVIHTLGGSTTIAESFAYDAAGNRTSMSNSAGSTSYQYNSLSRLTSETHQFSGMAGSFLLTYQYNLAGKLTNLTYPGFNTGYTYDASGRTKTVTGPPRWTGITQYVSDIQYRASDSYKNVSYGSGTSLTVTYNPRLQLQTYKMRNSYNNQWYDSAHIEAEYFADGSVRTAQDFYDTRFTRSYFFDHVGSMTQAYSGVYNQTFQHDAFGNTTNRQSIIWTEFDSFAASWVNGRNQNPVWQYDANGTVRFDDYFEYTYDARGVNSKVRTVSNNLWMSQTVNAEGLMTKRSTGSPTATFSTTYYLRSTVLGGKVIAEYNSAAQQQKRYAYLDGHLLASDDANNFFLEHTNPLTASRGQSYWTGMGGAYYGTAEPDSSGVVDVGFSDPNEVPPLPPEEPDIASILGGLSGECRVEGIQSTFGCWLAQQMLAGQTAVACPNNDCNAHLMTITQTIGGKIAATSRFFVTAGEPGWDGSLDRTYGWFPPLSNKIDLNDPNQAKRIVSQIPDLLKNEYLTQVGSQRTQNPSNLTALEGKHVGQIYRGLKNIGRYFPLCSNFIKGTLEKLKELSPNNPPISTEIVEIFRAIQNQPDGGFFKSRTGVSTVEGLIKNGEAKIIFVSSPFLYVSRTIHEGFHISGSKGWYNDQSVARAITEVASEYLTRYQKIDPRATDVGDKYSQIIDDALANYCPDKLFNGEEVIKK